MNKTFTINEIIDLLNSIQLRDIDSGTNFLLGHTVVGSNDGDMLYADDLAEVFNLDFKWNDGRMIFTEKNNDR